jgi:hypothetical protein
MASSIPAFSVAKVHDDCGGVMAEARQGCETGAANT